MGKGNNTISCYLRKEITVLTEYQSSGPGGRRGEVTVGKIGIVDTVALGHPLEGEAATVVTGIEIGIDMIVTGTGSKRRYFCLLKFDALLVCFLFNE